MKQTEAERVIKQRVSDVLKETKISVNKLASSSEVSTRTINDQINGGSKISAATLLSLADFCPTLSAEWLLRGTGEMFLLAAAHETDTGQIRDDSETIAALRLTIDTMQKTIDTQSELIDSYRERIADLRGGGTIAPQQTANAG